jgi:peptide/nickel transport system permease protein
MKLRDYVIRRLLLLIPVLIGITFITFFLTHNIPGYDPATPWLKDKTSLEARDLIVKQHHLDEPIVIQYLYYINDLVHFDLGLSASQANRPVSEVLASFFPATFELTVTSLLICVLIGIPIGIISAIKKDRWPDHIVRVFSLTGISIPVFWLALILQYALHMKLGILPLGGRLDIGVAPPTFNIPYIPIH